VKTILPRLTSGRYRDIKVGSDMSLQVFTGDKGDFLDRSELSGGTQEAIALALRLAASQAFIDARTRQAQFVFLDEPFKMMDESRAFECLQVLSDISGDIQQFFVIQPSFSDEERAEFDSSIRTEVAKTDLSIRCALGEPEMPERPAPSGGRMLRAPFMTPSGVPCEAGPYRPSAPGTTLFVSDLHLQPGNDARDGPSSRSSPRSLEIPSHPGCSSSRPLRCLGGEGIAGR